MCKTHPEANGLDVRSLLIQPVQRVPRYRMLLEELRSVTDEGHPDEEPLREALERVTHPIMRKLYEQRGHADDDASSFEDDEGFDEDEDDVTFDDL